MASFPVFASGLGLAADMFDYSVINLVRPLLEGHFGQMTPATNGLVTMATAGGAIVGQLFFGSLSDILGRRAGLLATAALTCIGSLGCALVGFADVWTPYAQLAAWRFLVGLGIGGEYPLSAANVAENSPAASSGTRLAAAALCMLLGELAAPLLVLLLNALVSDKVLVFRAAFAGGAVLGALSLAVRWRYLAETERFQRYVGERAVRRLAWKEIWHMRRPLFGTAWHWFAYDIITYGTGLYSSTIFKSSTYTRTLLNVLAVVLLSVPGYLLTLRVQKSGRRRSQLVGFAGMAGCFLAIVVGAPPAWLFLVLFGLQKSFDAAGPGLTTYLVPAEIFPTRARGTAHGLSAAAGKTGAMVGILAFPVMEEVLGVRVVILGCACLSCLACATTLLLTPAYGTAEIEVLDRSKSDGLSDLLFRGRRPADEQGDSAMSLACGGAARELSIA